MPTPNQIFQDYMGRAPMRGSGNPDDYFEPQGGYSYGSIPLPYNSPTPQRGIDPRAVPYVAGYMSPRGGGFSRANAERFAQQQLFQQEQDFAIQQENDARMAYGEIAQADPESKTWSKDLNKIFSRYPGAVQDKDVMGILSLKDVFRKSREDEENKRDPYISQIKEPNHYRAYQERTSKGLNPRDAYAQYLDDRSEEENQYALIDSGVRAADLDSYRGKDGKIDPLRAREAVAQFKIASKNRGKAPHSGELKTLGALGEKAAAALELAEPSDDLKKAWIKANGAKEDSAGWQAASQALRDQAGAELAPDISEYENYLLDLQDQGKTIPRTDRERAAKLGIELLEDTTPVPRGTPRPTNAALGPVGPQVDAVALQGEQLPYPQGISPEEGGLVVEAPVTQSAYAPVTRPRPISMSEVIATQVPVASAPRGRGSDRVEAINISPEWTSAKQTVAQSLLASEGLQKLAAEHQLPGGPAEALDMVLRDIYNKGSKAGEALIAIPRTKAREAGKIQASEWLARQTGINLDAKVKVGGKEITNRDLLRALAAERLQQNGEANPATIATDSSNAGRDQSHLYE